MVVLTLRYDRVDSFWFTLLHELSHVGLHLDHGTEWFVDDLDCTDTSTLEREADEMASEALIPRALWERSVPRSPRDVETLARELGISPTIVADRARHQTREHRLFGRVFRDRIDREALGWES